ncbi:MAG: DNA gyrase subunit A, partial [Planctomycetota bacterium]
DPPAAMRYTEARLNHAAVDMLADINLDTVDYAPNYDETRTEPTVLPGKFPNLLINGGVGIAVGMATSLLPHNPGEILDAIVATLETPEIALAELMEIVPGPDFPTGGIIRGRGGIIEGYATGRGRLKVRGRVHIEDVKGSRDKQQIVIDEIPYQLIQTTLVDRIVAAIKDERIKDIVDVRNESGRNAQTRVVCELRRGTDPAVVENQLYEFTPLQGTLSIMNIALVNRQPRTLSLKEMIQLYIEHRIVVIERRTRHLLHEARKKAHVLEGLIHAVCDIDEVIAIIRGSQRREEAINKLAAKRFRIPAEHEHAPKIPARLMETASREDGVYLTRVQAEAIGALRLIQLVGLEIEKLVSDYRALVEEIEGYEAILGDRELVHDIIREDCRSMRERYATERKTAIEESADDIDYAALIQEEDMAVTVSHEGFAKRVPLTTYKQQNRGGRGIKAGTTKDEDYIEHVVIASTHDDLLCFTDTGRVFKIKVYEVPEMGRTNRGRALVNILDLKPGETCVSFMPITDFEKEENFLVFASAHGKIKRSSLKLYQNVNRSGLIALGLSDNDRLVSVRWTGGADHLLIATAKGMAIRFTEQDARPMGRSAAGVKAIELTKGDEIVNMARIAMNDPEDATSEVEPGLALLTVTENGYGKRTDVREYLVASESEGGSVSYRTQSRGGKGRIDIRTSARNGEVVSAREVRETDSVVFVTQQGLLVRVPAGQISKVGRATQGVRVVNLKAGDQLVAMAIIPAEAEDGDDDQADTE